MRLIGIRSASGLCVVAYSKLTNSTLVVVWRLQIGCDTVSIDFVGGRLLLSLLLANHCREGPASSPCGCSNLQDLEGQ